MSTLEVPNDNFFNSLPVQTHDEGNHSGDSPDNIRAGEDPTNKPKRIACLVCRKRKLRCDGIRPSCGNCSRLGHECGYSDIRRKSGPRRGYVKELEARLHQVENQLRTKDDSSKNTTLPNDGLNSRDIATESITSAMGNPMGSLSREQTLPDLTITASNVDNPTSTNVPWEIIGLGLEEPLPPQDMTDDMDQTYFETVHKSIPMIHKYRYLAALNLAPVSRPPVCLRYSMWTLVASITDKYASYTDIFYQRARKYAELDEMKGHGERFVTVGHAQCWALIASFEFKTMYFPRAWMSVGRTSRLVQMLGLQRVDHDGLEVKRTLPPPRDWVDREERRRTFWMAYCNDRYASIGTGWPMTFDEKDIFTNLPCSLNAFEQGIPEESTSFAKALSEDGASHLSAFGAVVVIASIFGQNLTHLHRSYDNDDPEDPSNGGFWKRHRHLDNILATITLFLPDHLKMPTRDQDPNVPFLNMALHTAVICLHQAAILKAEKHQLEASLIKQSVTRCFYAAEEVYNVMQMTSHMSIGRLHPFLAFCLYVASRVLIHEYKKRRDEISIRDKFEFLIKAMQAHMKKTPLTASFLAQLQVELDAAGLENPLAKITLQTDSFLDDHVSPVVSRISQNQPTFHEIRAAQTSSAHSFIRTQPGNQAPCTVFDLPPRLRGRVTSVSEESKSTSNIPMTTTWNENINEAYSGFDTEMSPGDQAGFTGHPTPSSGQRASSHTSYSPGQDQPLQAPSHNTGESEAFFAQTEFQDLSHALDASFAAVTDWNLADGAAMNTTLNETHWTQQYDAMAWDTNGVTMQGLQNMATEQWRSQNRTNGNDQLLQ